MCLQCHLNLSSNDLYNQLKNLKEEDFQYVNDTSISHFLISSTGFNGIKVREIAIQVIEKYIEWSKDIDLPEKLVYIKNNSIKEGNMEELESYLSHI
jgi:hypothetical protein